MISIGRALGVALVLALAGRAAAGETVAVPALDFVDTSGGPASGTSLHADLLDGFVATLREDLATAGLTVVVPACAGSCSPATTPFAEMAAASRAVGAPLLLVGNIHKISTLIGTVKLTLIDLPGDRVICTRTLSYRGDTADAWSRAAQFGARDVLKHCLG